MRVEIIARQYDYLRNSISETQVVNLWPAHKAILLRDGFIIAPFIGPDRASEIVVNVLLPFAYASRKMNSDFRLHDKAFDLFQHYPGSPANAIEKHMAGQFGLSGKMINTALRQQGLLHIYRTMCIQGKCGECKPN